MIPAQSSDKLVSETSTCRELKDDIKRDNSSKGQKTPAAAAVHCPFTVDNRT